MADKPTKLPRWNTDATNQTEPSEGEKNVGWSFEEDPPSSFFNWLQFYTYKWFEWLDARVTNTGGTAPRIGLRGIGSIGEGGGTGATLTGNGAAAGSAATGGATSGPGGTSQGGAPNGNGHEATGDGTGSGVVAVGGDTSGTAVLATGGAPNGKAVVGTGTGTGTGVRGVGGATGYGVEAEADTTTPVRAALRIVPQDLQPSSPQEGDIFTDSVNKVIKFYDGTSWKTVGGTSIGDIRAMKSTLSRTRQNLTPGGSGIPADNTIPQISEGVQVTSLDTSYIPKKAGNKLVIEVAIQLGAGSFTSPSDGICGALFLDGGADAISAALLDPDSGDVGYSDVLQIYHEHTVVDLDQLDFTVNVSWAGDATNIIINRGLGGAAVFGGVQGQSYVKITEIEQ